MSSLSTFGWGIVILFAVLSTLVFALDYARHGMFTEDVIVFPIIGTVVMLLSADDMIEKDRGSPPTTAANGGDKRARAEDFLLKRVIE